MMQDMLEIAWAAGFFDGEGTTGYSATAKSTRMQISQKEPELLYRFADAVGGGTVCGPYRNGKGHVFHYRLSRRAEVQRVMTLLWPHLGTQKREQATVAGAGPLLSLVA